MEKLKITNHLTTRNFTKGRTQPIQYIVIHYTASTGDAPAQCKYFANNYVGASAHYFVGHNGDIYRSVKDEDTAWHCGAKSYVHPSCRNSNSIGIELCCKKDSTGEWYFHNSTVTESVRLVVYLMKKYNISLDRVIRHYDVTGKICPRPFVIDSLEWDMYKALIMDRSKAMYPIPEKGIYKTLGSAYARVGIDIELLRYMDSIPNNLAKTGKFKLKEQPDGTTRVVFLKGKTFECVGGGTDLNGNTWAQTKSGFWLPVRYKDKERSKKVK